MEQPRIVGILYYNVIYFLFLRNEHDEMAFQYIANRIENGALYMMKDITDWCDAHEITYKCRFKYRGDFSVTANVWNLYSYLRSRYKTSQ